MMDYFGLLKTPVPPRVSDAERDYLRMMLTEENEEDGEQLTLFVPGGWWLRERKLSAAICWRLVRHCLIKRDSGNLGDEVQYWSPTEEAEQAINDPDYVPEIVRALSREAAMREEEGP